MSLTFKTVNNNLAADDQGSFCGYASVFDVIDQHHDTISRNAFDDHLKQQPSIKLLWQHNPNKPIGKITSISSDEYGLKFTAQLNLELKQAQEAYALIKHGDINNLSIGFECLKSNYDAKRKCNVITKIKLLEISLVTFAANELATINNVKNLSKQQQLSNMTNPSETNNIKAQFAELEQKFANQFNDLKTAVSRPTLNAVAAENIKASNSSFNNFLRTGNNTNPQLKALSSASGEAGGYFVPTAQTHKLYSDLANYSLMRRLASVNTITTDGLDIIDDFEQLKAGWTQETSSRTNSDTPKIYQRKISVHEMYAQPKATQKLIDDSAIDIGAWLTNKMAHAFAELENNAFLYGMGNGQPRGILSYESGKNWQQIEQITSKAKGIVSGDDLIRFIYSLPSKFRTNASIIMNSAAIEQIRSLKTTDGRYLWQPAITEGQPSRLIGVPVLENNSLPAFASGNIVAVIADFKQAYMIVDRAGISVLRDPYTDKPFVKFYATKRVGADIIDFRAIKLLKLQ
ncbi:MAG: phage major capsid protein [Pseudomonadota bacterium]